MILLSTTSSSSSSSLVPITISCAFRAVAVAVMMLSVNTMYHSGGEGSGGVSAFVVVPPPPSTTTTTTPAITTSPLSSSLPPSSSSTSTTQLSAALLPNFITDIFSKKKTDDNAATDNNNNVFSPFQKPKRASRARDLIQSLVEDQQCFTTEIGAQQFLDSCSEDIVFEDCYQQKEPIVGKANVANSILTKVADKKGKGSIRIDRISDGDRACGYAWTWISEDGMREGLRGTTFIELDADDEQKIVYMREIPEPIYKPGDATLTLLKAVTKNAVPKPPPIYTPQTPTVANAIAKYLFLDVQGSEIDESMRFFDDTILYRDFNYDDLLRGRDEVRQFITDFSFPGIEFRTEKFDDGIDSTCFTWKVLLEGVDEANAVKGISLYELDPTTKKVNYVRDVPESSIKPPPLGKLARLLNPELGVFNNGVPKGCRPGGK